MTSTVTLFPCLLLALIPVLAGCASAVAPATAPAAASEKPELQYAVSANPATIYKQEVPSTPTGPRTVTFNFVADNRGKVPFSGTAPTSAIVRVLVTHDGKTIWDGPEMSLQVITPVEINANDIFHHAVTWEIPEIADLPTGQLDVKATFIPTGGEATTTLTIGDRM